MGESDNVLYQSNPAMFRCSPVQFVFFVLLIPVVGFGLLLLLVWWLRCKCTELTVTERSVILRRGILSKALSEVRHQHIRHVQLRQTMFQRIFNVGWIGISSAGQSGVEIEVDGLPDPAQIKALIDQRIP